MVHMNMLNNLRSDNTDFNVNGELNVIITD